MPPETLVSMVLFHLEDSPKKAFGNIFLRFPAQMFGDLGERLDYSPHYLMGIELGELLRSSLLCVDKRRVPPGIM